MKQLYQYIKKLYRSFGVAIIIGAALFLLSGIPSFFILLTSPWNSVQFSGSTPMVALSPAAFTFYFIGFLGFYFWTRTDYPHYRELFYAGTIMIFMSYVGLSYLLSLGLSN